MQSAPLKRNLGLTLLTLYGVGVMVGAGIYVLVGSVAAQAGIWAPLAFLVAGLIAAPSALSYAELSSRIPEASGEAAYVEKGLNSHFLAVLIGLAIVLAGTVSAAAVLKGGVGYLTAIIDVRAEWAIIGVGAALTLVAIIGVLESLSLAAVFTVTEVLGLAIVIYAGFTAAPVPEAATLTMPHWPGVAGAAVLAFFAFIGFEDLVNMAEEARDPTRVVPRAILIALAITTLLYILVSLAAVRAVPVEALANSERPLVLVWEAKFTASPVILGAIAVAAALNGVLAQIVMAARVLYGLGRREKRLRVFYRAHPKFGTPALATFLLGAAVILAALLLPVSDLATLTAIVLLMVFAVVNLALIALKRREPNAPFRTATWIPWAGLIASVLALTSSFITGALW
ncbi:amino acid permease [Aliiroseovarius sp. KMU-50]|uniref:Amino acid permease n=1 Tax=Aliiroseovarius salicola TaxID=3009082 RepID=A0ABT4W1T5_9RHOB|nr:amino acid permease [Aliiroseovarius sp. KMU-50]MDA5094467.1 amino acid permease [Aliiroseovarius sp. KMU-50]